MLSQIWIPGWMVISMLSFCTTVRGSNCSHILPQRGGFIISENFPGVYPRDHTCEWTITVKAGSTVSLRFFHFNTESCCDLVKVYDGTNKNATQIVIYNGITVPRVLFSTGRSMYIFFKTDGSNQRSGFTGVLTSSGHSWALTSPSARIPHQSPFSRDSLFAWTITVAYGRILKLELERLTTIDNCRDFVRVYDGITTFKLLLGEFNKCNLPTGAIRSTGNKMLVVFDNFYSVKSNFTGRYTSPVAESCQGLGSQLCAQVCTDKTGTFECSCNEGFRVAENVHKCRECDQWTYGMACSLSCPCNVNTTNYCNKKDGTCVCNDGWTDTNCPTEALPTSSNSNEGPTLDEEIYWAIIGGLGFLLLTAVLVYKWRRKEKKARGIAPPPQVETMPLDEIIRRYSSDAQTQRETPGTINREMTDNSHYEVPVVRATAKKPTVPKTTVHVYEEMTVNSHYEVPVVPATKKPTVPKTTVRVYEEMTDNSHYEVPVVPATKKPTVPKTTVPNKYGEFPKRSAKESHGPTDREVEIYLNVPAKKKDTRP